MNRGADYEACSPVHVMLSDADSKPPTPRRTVAVTVLAVTLLALGFAVVLNGQSGNQPALALEEPIQTSLSSMMKEELRINQRPSRSKNIRHDRPSAAANWRRNPSLVSSQGGTRSKLAELHREAEAIVAKSKLMTSRSKAVLEQLQDIPDDMLEVITSEFESYVHIV